MLHNNSDIMRTQIGEEYFVDSKNITHTIKHSVIFTEQEKDELEERIAQDLYNIFTFRGNFK